MYFVSMGVGKGGKIGLERERGDVHHLHRLGLRE